MPERCVNCGERALMERVAPATHEVSGRSITIEKDRHTFCGNCGNVSYVGDQISEMDLRVARRIREEEGLLMPEELKAVRAKYGLTQSEMEDLLSIGRKTWIRWERGKVVQSKAADTLIRAMAAHPDIVRDMLSQKRILSDAATRALDAIDAEAERQVVEAVKAVMGSRVSPELLGELVRATLANWRRSQAEAALSRRAAA